MSHTEEMELAKGFLMHKMRSLYLMSGPHTATENLSKSCPEQLRPFVKKAVEQLKKEGLLLPHPTSYGEQVTAVRCREGYRYANLYCRKYGLPEEEFGIPIKQPKAEPLPEEILRALRFRKKKV